MITGMMLCLSGIAVSAVIPQVSCIIPGLGNLPSPPWNGNCQKNFPADCKGNTFCGPPGNCNNLNCQYKCYYCDCVNMTQCYINDQNQIRCNCDGFGTSGDRCEIDVDKCASDPCENNGTCINGENSYTCSCPDGYTGTNCEEDIDDCPPTNPCQNGGTCADGVNTYTCICPPEWTGPNCQTADVCNPNPCQHSGTCILFGSTYICRCTDGHFGNQCQSTSGGAQVV